MLGQVCDLMCAVSGVCSCVCTQCSRGACVAQHSMEHIQVYRGWMGGVRGLRVFVVCAFAHISRVCVTHYVSSMVHLACTLVCCDIACVL